MKKQAPGVWIDEHGGLHIDIAEFLLANGIPDTPETRASLLEVAREDFGETNVRETELPIIPDGHEC
jgi:hypothetical protein